MGILTHTPRKEWLQCVHCYMVKFATAKKSLSGKRPLETRSRSAKNETRVLLGSHKSPPSKAILSLACMSEAVVLIHKTCSHSPRGGRR